MHARLLPLLLVLLAGVLLALGFPLAASQAAAEQQRVVVDRIDDTARFAALAQFVASSPDEGERRAILQDELQRYHSLYGIEAGVFLRDGRALAVAPDGWNVPDSGQGADAFAEALAGRRSHDPAQVWPWQEGRIAVASPVIRDGDVAAVVLTDSPTGHLRSRILQGWLPIIAGEAAATLLAVGLALRLTGWVLRPVRTLDRAAHEIAVGRFKSRVAVSGGPPELRRLTRSFNEMADNVEDVLEQQRAFVADASHQLRNPLSALLLRIELLGLELPEGEEEFKSVQAEGNRLARVLDDLLDLALAEHASADLRVTDVAELAAERVEAWRPVADIRGCVLESAGPQAVTGWADPVALSSALDAVVDNAIKFTPEGERVTVSVSREGDSVTVEVADHGPGLTEEEMERIGDRFWRSNRHQNISGSGLGLSITRALLASGGAELAYAHNEPKGLRVLITVPRNPPTADDGDEGGRDGKAPGQVVSLIKRPR
ncbi:histidine kinase [Streptomyces abyssalis]|uniref:histidine kinase n=1 Tax=Streptomyces abyssalis TaxID=933944 RepID=A0A1E7JHP4_9ACTN|nr:HAMP domain-containing sensor histidine kinase [Streptomyces abyssalis]OEU85983.1 histidine kinase [Streptomyces abyssalis]OEU92548.1 histidine kinase [Streptomyces abyssalis]OEV28903.1 histidine kinase [Streptomyces nanshensis]